MITVVLPVYNMAAYLPKSISSIMDQTYPDFELLIIDDGSTDNSLEICREYAKKNPRISVFHKENGGLSSARNMGIVHAKGKFIVFPDPDDYLEPDYLEALINLHNKEGTDLEVCEHFRHKKDEITLHRENAKNTVFSAEDALKEIFNSRLLCGYAWNKLFHMDVIKENGLTFSEELLSMQDLLFAYEYISCCSRVSYTPKALYHHDMDSGVHAKEFLTKRLLSGISVYEKMLKLTDNPDIEGLIENGAFLLNMKCMDLYYRSKYNDKDVWKMLYKNSWKNRKGFFTEKSNSYKRKILGMLMLICPRMYYLAESLKRGEK